MADYECRVARIRQEGMVVESVETLRDDDMGVLLSGALRTVASLVAQGCALIVSMDWHAGTPTYYYDLTAAGGLVITVRVGIAEDGKVWRGAPRDVSFG